MARTMVLTEKVERALIFAARKHEGQTRKGSDTPYITHPVAVAAMVHAAGGSEDAVVAALLHDTVEDCGGLPVLEEIRTTFGETVAAIVDALTDSYDQDREKWQVRKERYIARMTTAAGEILLVAACDKLHNLRVILADHATVGGRIWERFRGGKEGSIWYYRSLAAVMEAVREASPGGSLDAITDELGTALLALERAAATE
ncbi:MAG: bifunctional (p)ppGpp synthetase/guanosine-3',5'-bis(diphosphate) 3'-pyrophosphohydrolase [Myxococcales bacterium]|nr:MAG: bifunctional (p)ppGpp synthetase/guanosine-3',5'-bis(diphosphate) 3'-pyrophosphohydrolase [Myxococcales bacterium]